MITPTSTKSKQYQALGIDEIANDIETVFNEVNTITADGLPVVTDGVTITGDGTAQDPLVAVGGGSDYTETIVNISSAQILAMGASPIELLPAAGANKYYDIEKIIIEYTHVTTAYTVGTDYVQLLYGGSEYAWIQNIIKIPSSSVAVIVNPPAYNENVGQLFPYNMPYSLNLNLTMVSYDGYAPTLGDGTMRVKIYHKTITFGA